MTVGKPLVLDCGDLLVLQLFEAVRVRERVVLEEGEARIGKDRVVLIIIGVIEFIVRLSVILGGCA